MLSVLRQRNFILVWIGGLISLTGDWLLLVGLPIYVYSLTGSTLATGTMFIIQLLPRVFLLPVAGVFVDRWDRKRVMVIADFVRAIVLLLLLLVHSTESIWTIYVVAFVMSVVAQFFGPADSALLPSLVDKDHLVAANSLNSLGANLTRLIGPALAGLLMVQLGFSGVILLDSASFFISGILISLITVRRASEPEPVQPAPPTATNWMSVWREWWEGLQIVRRDRMMIAVFLVLGVAMPAEGIMQVLLVIFVRHILGGSAQEFGLMYSADAVGGLIGSFIIVAVEKVFSSNRLVGLSGVLLGLILLAQFNFLSLPLFLALSILVGLVQVGFFVSMTTLVQTKIPQEYLGRVFATFVTVVSVMTLVGTGIATTLGDLFGTLPLLNVAAILNLLAGLLALVLLRSSVSEPALPVETEPA